MFKKLKWLYFLLKHPCNWEDGSGECMAWSKKPGKCSYEKYDICRRNYPIYYDHHGK